MEVCINLGLPLNHHPFKISLMGFSTKKTTVWEPPLMDTSKSFSVHHYQSSFLSSQEKHHKNQLCLKPWIHDILPSYTYEPHKSFWPHENNNTESHIHEWPPKNTLQNPRVFPWFFLHMIPWLSMIEKPPVIVRVSHDYFCHDMFFIIKTIMKIWAHFGTMRSGRIPIQNARETVDFKENPGHKCGRQLVNFPSGIWTPPIIHGNHPIIRNRYQPSLIIIYNITIN